MVALAVLTCLAMGAACPFAGRYLVVDTATQPADAIVVLAGAPVERWLEAVDLYHEKHAPFILLSPGYEDPLGDQLRSRGISFPREVMLQRDAMIQLGVPAGALEILPEGYDNTAAEAAGVHRIARQRGWGRITVVTSQYHTRRALFAFTREMRASGTRVQIRGSRYDRVTPDRWWRSRSDVRWVMSEIQKLFVYRLGVRS